MKTCKSHVGNSTHIGKLEWILIRINELFSGPDLNLSSNKSVFLSLLELIDLSLLQWE